jgi:hypothetical protein
MTLIRKGYKILLPLCLLYLFGGFHFKSNDIKKSIVGRYEYHSKEKTSGGTNYYLKLKRDNTYRFESDSHFEGVYSEYGKWKTTKDSILLESKCRIFKEGFKKTYKKVNSVKVYFLKNNKLCWSKNNLVFCFTKK